MHLGYWVIKTLLTKLLGVFLGFMDYYDKAHHRSTADGHIIRLAGQQCNVDLLDHFHAVQHFAERWLPQRLRRVPNGRVGNARALRLQVENVVAGFHTFRTVV